MFSLSARRTYGYGRQYACACIRQSLRHKCERPEAAEIDYSLMRQISRRFDGDVIGPSTQRKHAQWCLELDESTCG